METYWLEQSESDLPAADDWLSAAEKEKLASLRVPKRHADWRLGRWTAKRAVAAYLKLQGRAAALGEIEVRPAASGAPEIFVGDRELAAISISHAGGKAACAVASAGAALGCDLEAIEARSAGFLADYFSAEEQALLAAAPAGDRPWLANLLWSAKESALKALGEGLRLDTRGVRIELHDVISCRDAACRVSTPGFSEWLPLRTLCAEGQVFSGWWKRDDKLVRTLVADPAPEAPPTLLRIW